MKEKKMKIQINKIALLLMIVLSISACSSLEPIKEDIINKNNSYSELGYKSVSKAAKKHDVDVNFALAVAHAESRGNCNATSYAGAKGVMQVMPGTARKYGVRKSRSLYNCSLGADVGVRELKYCLKISQGNKKKALTCYNAGPAWVISKKYKGRYIPKETRSYIYKILKVRINKIT